MKEKIQNFAILGAVIATVSLFIAASSHNDEIVQQRTEALAKQRQMEKREQAIKDSLAMVESNRLASYKDSIAIIKTIASDPNSAGGVDCEIRWKNNTHRTIKYMVFQVQALNAVGDIVPCSIRGYDVDNLKVTGPIKPGQTYGYNNYWDCVWYNHSITKCMVTGYTIIFMDDESIDVIL